MATHPRFIIHKLNRSGHSKKLLISCHVTIQRWLHFSDGSDESFFIMMLPKVPWPLLPLTNARDVGNAHNCNIEKHSWVTLIFYIFWAPCFFNKQKPFHFSDDVHPSVVGERAVTLTARGIMSSQGLRLLLSILHGQRWPWLSTASRVVGLTQPGPFCNLLGTFRNVWKQF